MTTAKFRMHRVGGAIEFELNQSQQAVLELSDSDVLAVFGAPGSGKTTVIKSLVLNRVLKRGKPSDSTLVISATRQSANQLRDELALGLQSATKGPIARTLSSLAFAIVSSKALAEGLVAPELVNGSEQDHLLEEILTEFETEKKLAWPQSIPSNTIRLPAFRAELRELITVAIEHRISPEQLSRLSSSRGFGIWHQVSQVYDEYLNRVASFENERFDSAALLHSATDLLKTGYWPENIAKPELVLVDDAQELTPGATDLLKALVASETGLFLFGDPDASTLGFRSSDSKAMGELVNEIRSSRGSSSRQSNLFLENRQNAKPSLIGHSLASISERLSPDFAGLHRFMKITNPQWPDTEHDIPGASEIETASFSSAAIEVAWLADRLRFYHLEKGIDWRDMAVVARSRRQLDELELTLSNHQVPARVGGAQTPLRDEYGSRSLLLVAAAVVHKGDLDLTMVLGLLQNPFINLNNLEIRRLRRTLRQGGADDVRNSDELLVELFNAPAAFSEAKGAELSKIRKFLEKFHRLRSEFDESTVGIEQLLWQIYDHSPVVDEWTKAAGKHDQVAAQANRNLDSLSSLFAAAKRFAERHPDFSASQFLDRQMTQGLPEDTLTKDARAIDRLPLLTPAALIGHQFKVVAIPGLIDGVWPNPRPRSSLLGARALDQMLKSPSEKIDQEDELPGELRMFYKSIGAATEHVIATVTEGENDAASKFFDIALGGLPPQRDYPTGDRSLRVLTAKLRRALVTSSNSSPFDDQNENVKALAQLALAGVPGADPKQWMGILEPSTDQALFYDEGELELPIHISPSQLETFLRCPLHWFINYHGGNDVGFEAGLGTILHKALERAETGSIAELQSIVDEKWHSLRFEADWMNRFARRTAKKMVANLARYLSEFQASGSRVIGSEIGFEFNQGNALVTGRIDRLEQTKNGTVIVVDLKTGKYKPSKPDVEANPQLLTYQLAVEYDALRKDQLLPLFQESLGIPDGAKLVIIGTKKLETAGQPPFSQSLESKNLIIENINQATENMAKPFFLAQLGDHCTSKYTKAPCKLQVVEAVTYVD